MNYWLAKSEPEAYSIDDLKQDGVTSWGGVRNFKARNTLRAMAVGDRVLVYASNANPSGVTGVAEVTTAAYPDPLQFKKGNEYYDASSRPEKPKWSAVDLTFVERFPAVVSLESLKGTRALATMDVVQPGRRPSVQPVSAEHFAVVVKMGRSGKTG
ncbi:MAG TPA: EVE domain-containing protein [Gemmatimonadales bacterium]